jgi:hypothetical protein
MLGAAQPLLQNVPLCVLDLLQQCAAAVVAAATQSPMCDSKHVTGLVPQALLSFECGIQELLHYGCEGGTFMHGLWA